jgi:hypothetical protein
VWLRTALTPPPRPAVSVPQRAASADTAIAGIVRRVAEAREGSRNSVLFWGACRLLERDLPLRDVEALLLPTAINIGLSDFEARRTITSAQGRAVA